MAGFAPSALGGQLGRYELHGAIARGGMATVYIARMTGAAGFARTVAVKRLHPHLAADRNFVGMFVDEARLAARIRHPNVIDTLDVIDERGELFIVMDFVLGETLAKLVKEAQSRSIVLPPPVVSGMIIGALDGLHAAHEATNGEGEPLGIVHRDVSPQNILISRDGVPRVLDFGVAKSVGRLQETEGGELKGKLSYMAPEQLVRGEVDRRCDVFAMGVVLWEALTSRRLFAGEDAAGTLHAILHEPIPAPSTIVPTLLPAIDAVVLRAVERDPQKRFATAQEMALALEAACLPAPQRHAGKWVEELAGDAMRQRANSVRAVEGRSSASLPASVPSDDISQPSGSGSQRIGSSPRIGTDSWRYVPVPTPAGPGSVSGVSTPSTVSAASAAGSGVSSGYGATGLPSLPASERPTWPEQLAKRQFAAVLVGAITFAVVLALALVIGIKVTTRRPPPPPTAVAAPPPPPPPDSALSPAPPDPPTADPAPPVSAVIELAGDEAPPATPAEAASSSPPVAPRPVSTVIPGPPRSATRPKAADCENPFTVDDKGVKRPKPQCFGR
jgi:serine/threonine protein kinase